jgi:hypothetical protein
MPDFRADCSRCWGLCCVVPDQVAMQGFGADELYSWLVLDRA